MLSNFNLQYSRNYKPVKVRRVTRACDECRKRKKKCEGTGDQCQACVTKNVTCTYSFPCFKRGPKPKSQEISKDCLQPLITPKLKHESIDSKFNSSQVEKEPQPTSSLSFPEPKTTSPLEKSVSEKFDLS